MNAPVSADPLTEKEWIRRYRQRFIDRSGCGDPADAETFEVVSEGFENDPEGAADEEMSYWEDDGDEV